MDMAYLALFTVLKCIRRHVGNKLLRRHCNHFDAAKKPRMRHGHHVQPMSRHLHSFVGGVEPVLHQVKVNGGNGDGWCDARPTGFIVSSHHHERRTGAHTHRHKTITKRRARLTAPPEVPPARPQGALSLLLLLAPPHSRPPKLDRLPWPQLQQVW